MQAQPLINPSVGLLILMLSLAVISAILASWVWMVILLGEKHPILPREPRPVVPWGGISVMALVVLYLAFEVMLGVGYSVVLIVKNGKKPDKLPLGDLLLIDALAKLLMVLLTPTALKITSGARLSDLGIVRRDAFKNLLRGVWLCFLMLPIVYSVSFLASRMVKANSHPIETALREMKSPTIVFIAGFAAVIAAPVAEELLFRGVLLGWFWKIGLRKTREEEAFLTLDLQGEPLDVTMSGEVDPFVPLIIAEEGEPVGTVAVATEIKAPFAGRGRHDLMANVAVSLIFAGLHAAQWPAPVPLFVLSMMLGEAYRRTGSLITPIALHATFNGLSTVAMFLVAGGAGAKP